MKGAFTGAIERRIGRFELANGGTIFLDEVGELPLETQVKLLRVLQEKEFEPVGSSQSVQVDVRLIAATNRNLQAAVREGRFRDDLFYRLNVFPIHVPALRERPTDIPSLALFFVTRFARQFGKAVEGISQDTMERLTQYSWPGNVRELQNIIERALVLSKGPMLSLSEEQIWGSDSNQQAAFANAAGVAAEPLRVSGPAPEHSATDQPLTLAEIQRLHMLETLQRANWIIEGENGAAKRLDLHPNTLRSRMKKLGIQRPAHDIS